MTGYRPPGFTARAADGRRVMVDDVDGLLELAADHAGRSLERLDRRQLEDGLSMTEAPAREVERAVMVFVGRARQKRLARVREGAQRIRRSAAAIVLLVLLGFYVARLERSLARRHRVVTSHAARVRVSTEEVARARDRVASMRLGQPGYAEAEAARRRADEAASEARRDYDEVVADYVAAVRGFPTAPLAALVGLPTRVPRALDPDGPGRERAR